MKPGLAVLGAALALVLPATALAAPVNDNFNGATKVFGAGLHASSSNLGAGKESGEPNHAGNAGGHSLWYRWTPPAAGLYRIDTCESGFDTLLAVYTGSSVGALTPVASNDDGPECGPRSEVTFSAVAGTNYRIAVDGKSGATGNVELELRPRPANDDLAGARGVFGTEGSYSTDNVLATKQVGEPDHAGNAGGHSLWYRWIAPTTGLASVSTCGSDFDTLLAIYTGSSVGALTPVAANDDGGGCGPQSELTFPATTGVTYRIAVDGKGGATGDVEFELRARPVNDDFAEAAEIKSPVLVATAVGHNVNATKEAGEPEHAGNAGGHSVWFHLNTLQEGIATLDTCQSDFDTLLAVYEGTSVGALVPVVANDDSGDTSFPGCGSRSAVAFLVEPGVDFYVAVDGKDGATGQVTLRMRPDPENDEFAGPTEIKTGERMAGYNVRAAKEFGEPDHAGNAGGHSVWYRWTAPSSDTFIRLDTCGSEFDTLLAVYTGSEVDDLNPIASNDDGDCGLQSELTFEALAGNTYWIAVDGKDGATGDFELGLALAFPPPPAPPANDFFMLPEQLSGRLDRSGLFDTNVLATKQPGEPEHAGNPGGTSVWYRWTSPGEGTLVLDTCESGFDTLLAVYKGGAVSALTPLAANDDSSSCGAPFEVSVTRSEIVLPVSASTTYQFAVDGYNGAVGNVQLNLRFLKAPAPEPALEFDPPPTTVEKPRSTHKKKGKCRLGKVRRHGKCVRPHRRHHRKRH